MSFSLLVIHISVIYLQEKIEQKDLLIWMDFSQQDFSWVSSEIQHQYITVDMFLGMAVSGVIKENIGFYGNFILGMFFALLSMFYAIFFLKVSKMCKSI